MESNYWEYLQEGHVIGPVQETDLYILFSSGALRPSTPVRCAGLGVTTWQPAITIDVLKSAFVGGSPTPAVEMPSGADGRPEVVQQEAGTDTSSEEGEITPLPVTIARKEGASVVRWMWILTFAAWAICFLPIPVVSTFLVWLFVGIASLLAFVALFKNRVAAGIAGSVALVVVTPLMYLLSLAVYPMLAGVAVRDLESSQRRNTSASSSQRDASIRAQQQAESQARAARAELERQEREARAAREREKAAQAAALKAEQARRASLIASVSCPRIETKYRSFDTFRSDMRAFAGSIGIDPGEVDAVFALQNSPERGLKGFQNTRTLWWESLLSTPVKQAFENNIDSIRAVLRYRNQLRGLERVRGPSFEVYFREPMIKEANILETWVQEELLPRYNLALNGVSGQAVCAIRRPDVDQLTVIEMYLQVRRIETANNIESSPVSTDRFTAAGNSVRDAQTGLTWAAQDNGSDIDWNAAGNYCATLGDGWALPTTAELLGLYDESGTLTQSCGDSTCKVTPTLRLTSFWFWSSESNGSSKAWYVLLSNSYRDSLPVGLTVNARALCVRHS